MSQVHGYNDFKLRFVVVLRDRLFDLWKDKRKYHYLFQFASRMKLGNLHLKTMRLESTQVMIFNFILLCSHSSFDKSKIKKLKIIYGGTFLAIHVIHEYFSCSYSYARRISVVSLSLCWHLFFFFFPLFIFLSGSVGIL